MKKIIIYAFSFTLASFFCHAHSSNLSKQLDVLRCEIQAFQADEKPDQKEMQQKMIDANIEFLESTLAYKLTKANEKLDKVKKLLDEAVNEDEIEKLKKKIKKAEDKIKQLEEANVAFALLKARFVK